MKLFDTYVFLISFAATIFLCEYDGEEPEEEVDSAEPVVKKYGTSPTSHCLPLFQDMFLLPTSKEMFLSTSWMDGSKRRQMKM